MAENYLQHAEHYYRIMAAQQAQMQQYQQQQQQAYQGGGNGNGQARQGQGEQPYVQNGGQSGPAFSLNESEEGGDTDEAGPE